MWGVLLALIASVCWGLAPVAAKKALIDVSPVVGMAVRSIFAACLVSVWMLMTGRYRDLAETGTRALGWLIIEALLATVVGDALYFYALRNGQAGQVNLIMSAAPLFTLITAAVVLGEPVTPCKVFGAAMVIVGLLFILR